jgi:putative flippase GtrA
MEIHLFPGLKSTHGVKFSKFALVGVISNLTGYLLYLLGTFLGAAPKLAMTVLYIVGATASFFANRKWTFSHRGPISSAMMRYAVSHLLGYLLNLSILIVFVDRVGLPHQLVQAVAIVIVAVFLFFLMNRFVFAGGSGWTNS